MTSTLLLNCHLFFSYYISNPSLTAPLPLEPSYPQSPLTLIAPLPLEPSYPQSPLTTSVTHLSDPSYYRINPFTNNFNYANTVVISFPTILVFSEPSYP